MISFVIQSSYNIHIDPRKQTNSEHCCTLLHSRSIFHSLFTTLWRCWMEKLRSVLLDSLSRKIQRPSPPLSLLPCPVVVVADKDFWFVSVKWQRFKDLGPFEGTCQIQSVSLFLKQEIQMHWVLIRNWTTFYNIHSSIDTFIAENITDRSAKGTPSRVFCWFSFTHLSSKQAQKYITNGRKTHNREAYYHKRLKIDGIACIWTEPSTGITQVRLFSKGQGKVRLYGQIKLRW